MFALISHDQFTHLVVTYGYWAILLGVAVDSFGVPVPGEAMLLAASVYAGATHRLALPLVIGAAAVGAICGDNLSFGLGRQGGSLLLRRWGEVVGFGQRRQRLAHYLIGQYGRWAVVIGRFVPIVHIWTAFLAGTHAMPWKRFVLCNAIGCVSWACLLGAAGYFFGGAALRAGGEMAVVLPLMGTSIVVIAVLVLRGMEDYLQQAADRACTESH